MKDKLDDEIRLAGLEALVPEELDKHSNRLRTLKDARLEIVILLRSLVSAIPSQGTLELEETRIPWMVTRSIPSHLARNEGHRVHGMVVFITVEHIFHETATHAKATAGNHLAEANRGKIMVQECWQRKEHGG